MRRFIPIAVWLAVGLSAVAASNGLESTSFSPWEPNPGDTLFESLPASRTGIDFVNKARPAGYKGATSLFGASVSDIPSGSVCIGDYDGDGRPDIYLTQASGTQRLYRNLGGFNFEDVTDKAGVGGNGIWAMGAAWADVDNDSDLDLYVCGFDEPNHLYINNGDGTFQEQAKAAGLNYTGPSIMMAFADYDLDGDLDAYLVTYRGGNEPPLPENKAVQISIVDDEPVIEKKYREWLNYPKGPDGKRRVVNGGAFDHLYRNNGDGTFTEVSDDAGIGGNYMGLSATWWDYNDDGKPDLYVANDFHGPDQLYRNEGNGRFEEVIKIAAPHTPWFSMGADFADINNDGRFDFFATDMSGLDHYSQKISMGNMADQSWFLTFPTPRQYMRNALYLNTGTARFQEMAFLCGLANTEWTWSPVFGDLDNDGWVDLYVSNGMMRDYNNSDIVEKMKTLETQEEKDKLLLNTGVKRDPNLAYRNGGNLRFARVDKTWGLASTNVSFGSALADLDSDGDLDIVVSNYDSPVSVYRNHSTARRVIVRLKGRQSAPLGIGARVELESALGKQVRYLSLTHGFQSTSAQELQFGVAQDSRIDRLTVIWPGGARQSFTDLDVDRLYTITEAESAPAQASADSAIEPLFTASFALKAARHQERPFDDYGREPLLPYKLSQLGPGLAFADVDADGDDDVYVGGGSLFPGQLFLNNGKGRFSPKKSAVFDFVKNAEDMGALFFDADGDGDSDLYVISGGVECDVEHPILTDRLCMNDGRGNFVLAPDAIPPLKDSGSVVTAADFDRDGDLDLFVGSRCLPGRYPLPPSSRILQNTRGVFKDVTDQVAPGLKDAGLVTSALWSDVDGDAWIDLVITYDWGPVAVWKNQAGQFSNHTQAAGLAGLKGWWNGIAGGDFDHDGDMDYVVSNLGLNTKYEASPAHPLGIYYGNFEEAGIPCIVETQYEHDTLFPVRGKSCSQNAMPFIRERFPTYHEFASATLDLIYPEERLKRAYHVEAGVLESGVFLNDGKGHFTFAPLPRIAQVAPGFGVAVGDFDADGHADIYMVHNFYAPQPETGDMDGGLSILLKGHGDGTFAPVEVLHSGLLVAGDAKGLAQSDLNGDGWPDLVATVNQGVTRAFIHKTVKDRSMLALVLKGRPGNPTAIGARVSLHQKSRPPQSAEIYAGGGYLSQSSAKLYFGLCAPEDGDYVEVRWPDGHIQKSALGETRQMTIQHP